MPRSWRTRQLYVQYVQDVLPGRSVYGQTPESVLAANPIIVAVGRPQEAWMLLRLGEPYWDVLAAWT